VHRALVIFSAGVLKPVETLNLIPMKISAMSASHLQFVFDTAAQSAVAPCGCMQVAFITRYPPPSPVSSPVVCVVAPPGVVVLG
jgi:hypothetical protein